MEPPVKYILRGDQQRCEALRGQARRVSSILDNIMSLGGLQQHSIKFVPYPGALIIASKVFGARVVEIYTGEGLPIDKKPQEKICLCNCNFSIGWILEVQEEETIAGAQLYTVMACNKDGRAFVKYENVLASDWTIYDVGQRVVMVPYNTMAYVCCTDPTGYPGPRGCTPKVSEEQTSQAEWRTAYRIIPLCEKDVPMKIEPQRWNPNG